VEETDDDVHLGVAAIAIVVNKEDKTKLNTDGLAFT